MVGKCEAGGRLRLALESRKTGDGIGGRILVRVVVSDVVAPFGPSLRLALGASKVGNSLS